MGRSVRQQKDTALRARGEFPVVTGHRQPRTPGEWQVDVLTQWSVFHAKVQE